MVCVLFRASPLIWPTPYLAHTTRPGPSAFGQQGAPPLVFRAGLWVLGGEKEERAALAAHVTAHRCAASAARSLEVPARSSRFGGDDKVGGNCFI